MNINNVLFSETEKDFTSKNEYTSIVEQKDDFDLKKSSLEEVELIVERCSELWNNIKDASVLNGPELSNFSLSRFQLDAELLTRHVQWFSNRFPINSTNIRLRLECVYHALSELKQKKKNDDFESREEKNAINSDSNCLLTSQFRKWLHRQELDLLFVRQRIPCSRNSFESLNDLEHEQKHLQEQIQKEGRKFLYSLNTHNSTTTESRLFNSLEQRYLALWLSSLESFELIVHFKNCLDSSNKEDLSSELEEEGPDPKRRKTLKEKTEEEKIDQVLITAELSKQQLHLHALLSTKTSTGMNDVTRRQQILPLGSDIGYSSGDNSVHEVITNSQSFGHDDNREDDQDSSPLWAAEQIAQRIKLEKSFYRTVPLDDFGMTDLDTDDGGLGFNEKNYLTQKFLHDFEEKVGEACQGKIDLTDSLIVHVDAPENRPLNDFEEVMDLFGQDKDKKLLVNSGWPFSEDDCESLHTATEIEALLFERRKISSRKRALRTPLSLNVNEERQKTKNGRRKWTAVRRIRRVSSDLYNDLSSDLEWDEDAFVGYESMANGNSYAELSGTMDEGVIENTKVISSRQVLTDIQNLSERLRKLLTLVDDKSLGDSLSFLLFEIHSAISSLSQYYHLLKEKFKENRSCNLASSKNIDSKLKLCHHRMNTLKTICDKLTILLETQLLAESNNNKCLTNDYFSKLFNKECKKIREELHELKNRFENYFFNSFLANGADDTKSNYEDSTSVADSSTQICSINNEQQSAAAAFWRSYLFMCLIGMFTSFFTLIYINIYDGVDWRWSFGPQLHYQNGPPPI